MRVIRADALGMCFGVKDALELTERVEQPSNVTIYGELVHNADVQARLKSRGFQAAAERARHASTVSTEAVLITAHGVSDRERARLESAGATLIDTTCPLVRRAHRAAVALSRQGYFVVVLGKPGHVEVEGLTGDLADWAVVQNLADVRAYRVERLGIVCQTTMPPADAERLRAEIMKRNSDAAEIRFVDTICRPTKDRQRALDHLLESVDAVVVVGGRNSNNTRALIERCEQRGAVAWHVERADDLEPRWFDGHSVVGLTAGTSTLDATIDAVQRRLESFNKRPARAELPTLAAAH